MKKGSIRLRLTDDLAKNVGQIIAQTGWSENHAANVLIRAGLVATTGNPTEAARGVTIDAIRQMIASTITAQVAMPAKQRRLL